MTGALVMHKRIKKPYNSSQAGRTLARARMSWRALRHFIQKFFLSGDSPLPLGVFIRKGP